MSVAGTALVLTELDKLAAQFHAKAEAAMREIAFALEAWAKTEHGNIGGPTGRAESGPLVEVNGKKRNPPHSAPYWDLTGRTTASIQGAIEEISGAVISAYLSAGMDYDVELELMRGGKWAFLWPTLQNHKDDILKILEARLKL